MLPFVALITTFSFAAIYALFNVTSAPWIATLPPAVMESSNSWTRCLPFWS
ncbi:hypothetical protein D3C81_1394870 [compost metagenome]